MVLVVVVADDGTAAGSEIEFANDDEVTLVTKSVCGPPTNETLPAVMPITPPSTSRAEVNRWRLRTTARGLLLVLLLALLLPLLVLLLVWVWVVPVEPVALSSARSRYTSLRVVCADGVDWGGDSCPLGRDIEPGPALKEESWFARLVGLLAPVLESVPVEEDSVRVVVAR